MIDHGAAEREASAEFSDDLGVEGHVMPARLVERPLGLSCVFSDGRTAEVCLGELPGPRLARDLMIGLIELIHPHGTVDSMGSLDGCVSAARSMVRMLSEQGFRGGAQLTRAGLARYWMAASGGREACTRRMLQGFDTATGALAAGVRELAEGRAFNPQPYRRVLPPYPEQEWQRLTETCRSIIGTAYAGHRKALADAAKGHDPRSGGWTRRNVRWLLAQHGPLSMNAITGHMGWSAQTIREYGGFYEASNELFLTADVVIGYRLAFGVYSGIVPDGIDELGVSDIDWAGDATVLLSYVKRRTAAESVTLPRRAVRLLEQWLSHSALLRGHADPGMRDRLWLTRGRVGHGTILFGTNRNLVRRWVLRHGLLGNDGEPMRVHRARIRTTHHSMRAKATWAGSARARVDPNHRTDVEGDHYLTASTPAQHHTVEAIVEDAQHDLPRRAHPQAVVAGQDTAHLAADYPRPGGRLGYGRRQPRRAAQCGQRDVFVAACADQLSGLHGPKGNRAQRGRGCVCSARWRCSRPATRATCCGSRRSSPASGSSCPPPSSWPSSAPTPQRIGQVLERFDPAVLAEAATSVGDYDGELPLRPEEATR